MAGEIARILVLVNGLNLLPLFPLDGGRLVFDLLPARTRPYQWAVQLALVVLLVALEFAPQVAGNGGLMPLIMLGAGGAYYLRRINLSTALVAQHAAPSPRAPWQTIPQGALTGMVDAIRAGAPGSRPATIAEVIWAAWNRACAVRPTRRETILIVAAYAVALLGFIAWLAFFPLAMYGPSR